MTTIARRLKGRDVRKFRRYGIPKQIVLADHARVEHAWDVIRAAAAPAIRLLLALIQREQPRRQIIHNGRKPR